MPVAQRTAKEKRYFNILCRFMSYKDGGVAYDPATTEFTQEQLLQIMPSHLKRWMCSIAYGMPDPGPGDQPRRGRSSAIENSKKAISFYMPRRTPWDVPTMIGNPTKSRDVNDLIRTVLRHEVRREGAPSQARRALTKVEFEQVLTLLNASEDKRQKFMMPALCKLQFCMIGCIDDMCHFQENDLKPNPLLPSHSLTARIHWSKNVMEERDAPDQIIFGSMDSHFCVLLALGVYLEVWCDAGDGLANPYLFGHGGPASTKAFVACLLRRNIFSATDNDGHPRFSECHTLGTHSFHKLSTSYAMRNGCSKDEVIARGRWKKRKVVDRYIDINLPYPDAKVASILAVGGPIKYVLKRDCGVGDTWLLQNVVPSLSRSATLDPQVARVLAVPVLWAAFTDGIENIMPLALRDRIRRSYQRLETRLQDGENPVQRIPIVVMGHDDQVYIEEVFPEDDVDGAAAGLLNVAGNNHQNVGGGGGRDDMLRALCALVSAQRRQNHNNHDILLSRLDRLNEVVIENTHRMDTLQHSVHRISLQPVQRPRVEAVDEEGRGGGVQPRNAIVLANATLMKNPRSLHILWQEYEFGVGGRKPAKCFTASERGKVKFAYCRHKVIWETISGLVHAGHTAQVAVDMIYEIYGNTTGVTKIMQMMRRDIANGGHPHLHFHQ